MTASNGLYLRECLSILAMAVSAGAWWRFRNPPMFALLAFNVANVLAAYVDLLCYTVVTHQ